jgi:mannose-1-phosphate guanylyltransferase
MTATKALLLAGGRGERLLPVTRTTPKCLVPIGQHALLDYWVAALVRAGVEEAIINTHHLADQVRDKIEQVNRRTPLVLRESHEPQLLGSAGTVTNNREFADDADDVLLIYTDNLSDLCLVDLLGYHRSHLLGRTMLLFRSAQPRACGIARLDASGTVVEFEEKPSAPKSNLANAGVYVWSAEAYREVADWKAFDIGADVLPRLVGKMRGYAHAGYHLDIGTHDALTRARADIAGLGLASP